MLSARIRPVQDLARTLVTRLVLDSKSELEAMVKDRIFGTSPHSGHWHKVKLTRACSLDEFMPNVVEPSSSQLLACLNTSNIDYGSTHVVKSCQILLIIFRFLHSVWHNLSDSLTSLLPHSSSHPRPKSGSVLPHPQCHFEECQ